MEKPTFFRLAGRSPPFQVGVIFVLASGFVFRAAYDEWMKGRRLQREGVEAQATIAGRTIDRARRDGNRRTRYLVTYRFLTAEGKPVERTEETGVEEWERLAEGGTAAITYLSSDPANAGAAAPVKWWTPLLIAGVACLSTLFGAFLVISGFRRMRWIRRLSQPDADGDRHLIAEEPDDAAASTPTGAPPPDAPQAARRKLPGPVRLLINIVIGLGLVFVTAIIAEIPPVKGLIDLIIRERSGLLWPVVGVLSLGFLLFLGSTIAFLMAHGEPMSRGDIEDQARSVRMASRPVSRRASFYRFRGTAAGSQGGDEFTFRQLKDAWRSGRLIREKTWRRRLAILIGAMAMVFGLLGLFVVLGPPWIKVLLGGAILYIVIRFTIGLWKA